MDDTLAETLRPVAPYLPESLIAPDWLGRIGAIARCLPAGMTSFFGFECPLGVPSYPCEAIASRLPPSAS